MNIYLTGYRCTGKTTVGKELSRYLNWPFLDSDYEIEKEYSTTIAEMVEKEGWNKFRAREKKIIRELSFLDKSVIATGGGVILKSSNVSEIRRSGIVVWLQASKETIIQRMENDENTKSQRPSLTGTDIEAEVIETLGKRTPLYERSCDFWIDTEKFNPFEAVEKIVETIKKRGLKI